MVGLRSSPAPGWVSGGPTPWRSLNGARSVVVNDTGSAVDGSGTSNAADAVAEEIRAQGGRAVANRESVALRSGGQAMVDQAMSEFGGIDIVVANAGIQRNALWEHFDEQDMHDMIDVHLKGSFWMTQAAYRIMRERHYGRVILTASNSGFFGRPNSAAYVAAKNGVVGLMNSLAIEGQPYNVKANAIAPWADTRMTAGAFSPEIAARVPPKFVSDLVVFLASEQCPVTHEIFEAGFGRYARVFVGRTTGWSRDPNAERGPEDIADHFDQIRDLSSFIVPFSVKEDGEELLGEAAFKSGVGQRDIDR